MESKASTSHQSMKLNSAKLCAYILKNYYVLLDDFTTYTRVLPTGLRLLEKNSRSLPWWLFDPIVLHASGFE